MNANYLFQDSFLNSFEREVFCCNIQKKYLILQSFYRNRDIFVTKWQEYLIDLLQHDYHPIFHKSLSSSQLICSSKGIFEAQVF
jgi:hypothetical protein